MHHLRAAAAGEDRPPPGRGAKVLHCLLVSWAGGVSLNWTIQANQTKIPSSFDVFFVKRRFRRPTVLPKSVGSRVWVNVVLEELSSSQENELLNIFGGATQSKNSYYEVRKPFVYYYKIWPRILIWRRKNLTGFWGLGDWIFWVFGQQQALESFRAEIIIIPILVRNFWVLFPNIDIIS